MYGADWGKQPLTELYTVPPPSFTSTDAQIPLHSLHWCYKINIEKYEYLININPLMYHWQNTGHKMFILL